MEVDDETTVRLSPHAVARASPRRSLGRWLGLAGGAAAFGAAGLGGFWLWPQPPTAPAPKPPQPAVILLPPPPLLSHAAILAHQAGEPTALRWSANPLVWVLDFPGLEAQGQAMNRAAALLEKLATPRDRVLDDAALAAAIAADGKLPSNWYFGHNYLASGLARMARLAAEAGITLNPMERWVQEQVAAARRIDPFREAAFLTLPATGPGVDAHARASILLHELGHGQFMTQPLFTAHVLRVWAEGFSEAERQAMRHFLARDGYDTRQEDLMANEAMAYLLYTPDRRFFDPLRDLGWSESQALRLRSMLRAGAPPEP